jgi:tricorn protease
MAGRRRHARELSNGRLGYLHSPDMMGAGWAHFSRDLRTEMHHEGLIIDVRHNGGGEISQLVLEKLALRVIGWDVVRWHQADSYPLDARRGPLVALANQNAGSDGDIITAAIRLLGLGPVVGTRTWGGVIGFDEMRELVDGSQITIPQLAFSFDKLGWGVENYGVDPDVEVDITPADWAQGRDPQLETAVSLALEALDKQPARPGNRPAQGPPAAAAPARQERPFPVTSVIGRRGSQPHPFGENQGHQPERVGGSRATPAVTAPYGPCASLTALSRDPRFPLPCLCRPAPVQRQPWT